MRAVTIAPRQAGSLRLDDIPEPAAEAGGMLVRSLAVGISGTDRELVEGIYGQACEGKVRRLMEFRTRYVILPSASPVTFQQNYVPGTEL